jgi:hypothetical protein
MRKFTFVVLAFALFAGRAPAAERPAPLKVLLVAGGCCHDYANQKDILKAGLEARANVKVDFAFSPDKNTKPALPILGNPDYAKGYDMVIHDECGADIADVDLIQGVLAPHKAGLPAVNLHCAMHSYRFGPHGEAAPAGDPRGAWFEFLGLQSNRHGPQQPIAISFAAAKHPITAGLADWTTGNEELYNNIQIYPTATALARGKQKVGERETETVVAWVNDYKGTRVFSTTIGHNNTTVSDPKYLDLVTRGVLWACKKLDDAGHPRPGYEPAK